MRHIVAHCCTVQHPAVDNLADVLVRNMSTQTRQRDAENQRARIALASIHEARQVADNLVDELMMELREGGVGTRRYDDALEDANAGVLMLYNRLRPYLVQNQHYWTQIPLYQETDDEGNVKTAENGQPVGMYGLASLDQFRLGTTTRGGSIPQVGAPDQETSEEVPLRMPPDILLAAYDALNESIIALGFGAEVAEEVQEGDIDEGDKTANQGPREKPTFDGE